MNPIISIITITYNSEKTLEETILSVINQNYENLEYLIIDGGSKDGTLDIVNKYRDKIAYVVSEPDKGISDAFNKGIKAATGEIIGIINSDDILCEGALQSIANNYDPSVDVYRGNIVIWNEEENSKLSIKPTMKFPIDKPIKSVAHQGTFVTKHAYEVYGCYREDFRYMMDADVLHRFYLNGAEFKYVNHDMGLFRLGGVTNDDWKRKIPEKKKLIRVNGGSEWLVFWSIVEFVSRNILKSIGYTILGGSLTRKIRYK